MTRFPLKMTALSAGLLVALTGCDSDISPTNNGDQGTQMTSDQGMPMDGSTPPPPSLVTFNTTGTDEGDVLVNASDEAEWVYVDLDTRAQVTIADPQMDNTWDVAFRRFHIALNGGVSGMGGVEAAILDGEAFADVTEAPRDGYAVDAADGADDDDVPDYVISGGDDPWYAYSGPPTHTLTPHTRTYVVVTTEGAYVKLAVTDYYEPGSRTSGYPQLEWAVLPTPPQYDHEVTSAVGGTYVYYDFDTMSVVTPANPADDAVWDIAFSRTQIQTNSGDSGTGIGGARELSEGYDAASTNSFGFEVDTTIPSPIPGGMAAPGNETLIGWYDYLGAGMLEPGDRAYAVRTATGDYYAFQITHWDDGTIGFNARPLPLVLATREITVDASDAMSWVYVSLRDGEVVTVMDEAMEAGWDVGFSRTLVRTNSGTAGPGMGGALLSADDFSSTTSAPSSGYTVDTEITPPSPMATAYDGNEVLGGWYDYDFMTHVVSPGDRVYVVRTADGGFAKLQVTAWSDGIFTLDVAYAGAGRSDF